MLEHRRTNRLRLAKPIDARVGFVPVQIVDVSMTGFKVQHQEALPAKGERFAMRFSWSGTSVRVDCTVVWTTLQTSGLRIEAKDAQAERILSAILGAGSAPYIFCEYVDGGWRDTPVSTTQQPGEGFTVSSAEEPAQVERLRQAYAKGDGETRKLIRTLAALSVKSEERYHPAR